MGKSIFWAFSARTGDLLSFKNPFERDVWQLAEMDSTVKSCRLHTPTFTYYDGKRQREGDFLLQIEKTSGDLELWNPTETGTSLDRPIEKARVAFSEHLGMNYLQIFRADLYANQIALMNRRTILGVLSTNIGRLDTDELETALLSLVPAGDGLSIAALNRALDAEMDMAQIADPPMLVRDE